MSEWDHTSIRWLIAFAAWDFSIPLRIFNKRLFPVSLDVSTTTTRTDRFKLSNGVPNSRTIRSFCELSLKEAVSTYIFLSISAEGMEHEKEVRASPEEGPMN